MSQDKIMNYKSECEYSIKLMSKLTKNSKKILDFAKIEEAIYWARKYHDGQMRKTGEPFYSHPLEVASMVSDYFFNTEAIVASILHDIVEDTEVTIDMVFQEFGTRVAKMVYYLTRIRFGEKLEVQVVLRELVSLNDEETLVIKIMDRKHNMQTIHGMKDYKQRKKIDETLHEIIACCIYLENHKLESDLLKIISFANKNLIEEDKIKEFSKQQQILSPF